MTRRFDRLPGGGKLHMQSLGALAHFDFNMAGAYGCEQALLAIRQLGLPVSAAVSRWQDYAAEAGVPSGRIERTHRTLRTESDL
jgi:serine/threonine-protein kinase HipA